MCGWNSLKEHTHRTFFYEYLILTHRRELSSLELVMKLLFVMNIFWGQNDGNGNVCTFHTFVLHTYICAARVVWKSKITHPSTCKVNFSSAINPTTSPHPLYQLSLCLFIPWWTNYSCHRTLSLGLCLCSARMYAAGVSCRRRATQLGMMVSKPVIW